MSLYDILTEKLDELYRDQGLAEDSMGEAYIRLEDAQKQHRRATEAYTSISNSIKEIEEILEEKYGEAF